jgi:hypothetical protein
MQEFKHKTSGLDQHFFFRKYKLLNTNKQIQNFETTQAKANLSIQHFIEKKQYILYLCKILKYKLLTSRRATCGCTCPSAPWPPCKVQGMHALAQPQGDV